MRRLMLIAAATLVLTTACSKAGGGDDGVASLNGGNNPTGSAQNASGQGSDEDKMRAFAKCMRENGVDMPDPEPGGAMRAMPATGGDEFEKMNKASEACNKLLPNGGKPKPLSPEELDKMRKTAKCMREHGIDMPDPDPNNPGVTIGSRDSDPAKMEKAMKECGMGGEGGVIAVRPDGGGK